MANKRTFNKKMLDSLKPPKSGRLEFGDAIVPGLVVRITPRGVKSFSFAYKVPGEGGVSPTGRLLTGQQHRVTLGRYPALDFPAARDRARELLQVVSEGRDPRPEIREQNLIRHTNTVEAVKRRFIEQDAMRTVASWRNMQRVLDLHVVPTLREVCFLLESRRRRTEFRRVGVLRLLTAPKRTSETRSPNDRF